MIIKSAEFVVSNTNPNLCPTPNLPEYAFIGRSNVGKSSLINCLTNHKKLAKTSGRPGKTQTINHFLINKEWFLADLPGYGYAQVSKKSRADWTKSSQKYLLERKNLLTTFILVDSRLEPQEIDIEFINWMGTSGLPFALVQTKLDKLKKMQIVKAMENWEKELSKYWETIPLIFQTSSENKIGRENLLEYIENTNKEVDFV